MKKILTYVIFFFLAGTMAFAKTLVYARILTPKEFGVFSLSLLIATLCSYFATAGILEGLASKVPILLGQGKNALYLRSSALSMTLVFTIVIGTILTVVIAIIIKNQPEISALIWTGPFLVANVMVNALLCDLQIREYSIQYAWILFLKSFLSLIIAIALVSKYRANGVLIGETAALIMCALVCLILWSRDLRWNIDYRKTIRPLIQLGISFSVNNLIQNLAMNIDRWAVQISFGVAGLGTYTFAMHIATLGSVFLNMIQLYASPRILRAYGVTNDGAMILKKLKRLAFGVVGAIGVAVVPVVFLFPTIVTHWYPQYAEANKLIIWVYIGFLAIAVSFYDILFRAYGSGRGLIVMQIVLVCGAAAACATSIWVRSSLAVFAAIFAFVRLIGAVVGWRVGAAKVLGVVNPQSLREQ